MRGTCWLAGFAGVRIWKESRQPLTQAARYPILSDHKLPIYAIAHQQRLSQGIGDGSEFRQLFFVCGMTMVLVKLFMS